MGLKQATGQDFIVFGKVRVADILTPESGLKRADWQRAFNKISAKHFDYVLCHRDSLKVEAVVELDDKSHQKDKRIQRDRFLEQAVESAGLSLIRIPAKPTYSIEDIRVKINQALA
ncbi:MAG: DUF2726 domain-containing protein [Cyanobacteria bacterium P01_D01_bin.44]